MLCASAFVFVSIVVWNFSLIAFVICIFLIIYRSISLSSSSPAHRRPPRVASGLIGGACATTSSPSSTTRTRPSFGTKSTSSFSRSPAARSSRGMAMRRCWRPIWASSRPLSGAEKWGFFFVFVLFFRGQFWELFSHFEQSLSLAVSAHALSYLRF